MLAIAVLSHVNGLDLRIFFDLARRAVTQHPAVVHDGDALDHVQRNLEVVFNDDVADVAWQVIEQCDQFLALHRRQAGRRFIEQDQPRCAGQRHADFQLALLPMRQLGHGHVGDMRKPRMLEQVVCRNHARIIGARPDETEAAARDTAHREEQVVPHRQVAEQQR
jgi:hypothetical protein